MKPEIRITLFGKFSVQFRGETVLDHTPHKVQELLAYLILHRSRAHPREALSELLWGGNGVGHSRKYLRQALWQLHAGLAALGRKRATNVIHYEPGWVELALDDGIHVDAITFEATFNSVRGTRGSALDPMAANRLVQAVQLYAGELLESWYQEWCLYERDRFRQMYLTILDKLVGYCQENGQYEAGIAYGTLALRCDRARERTHRSLMALLSLSGDRTGALRQYERCVAALREELDVPPDRETEEVRRIICEGEVRTGADTSAHAPSANLFVLSPSTSAKRDRAAAPAKAPKKLV